MFIIIHHNVSFIHSSNGSLYNIMPNSIRFLYSNLSFTNYSQIIIVQSEFYFFANTMKRILLKLSGEAIKAQSATNYDPDFMDMLAQKIIGLTQQ